jgi:L-seryl-tRNA(Ser) seleniumtransferase
MGIYETLGVRRVINADARLTRLGGSLMPEPVLRAMEDAATSYVDMFELQRAVGRRLAELTRNEAAYVSTGAATGLFLTTLACMTGPDPAAVDRLPSLAGLKNEVVFQRVQHFTYLPAVPLTGATLVEIGSEPEMHPAELEAAITERTAAVLYVAGEHMAAGALPLPEVIEIAHARGVPVIVDAAAQLPPASNLWYFTRELGADLVIFSGGKDLRGPQASGLIVGRPDLIEACLLNGAPNPRLGRPMKVGKEEMLGLLAAVELYLAEDEPARIERFEGIVADWIAVFDGRAGVRAWRQFPNEAGQPMPRCVVEVDRAITGLTGAELVSRLWESDPRIAVKQYEESGISMTPDTLADGDEHVITERLLEIIGTGPVVG